jgi:hypothetical protein
MFLNYLEHLILHEETLRKPEWNAWKSFVQLAVERSPIMQDTLEKQGYCYSEDLVALWQQVRDARRGPTKDG